MSSPKLITIFGGTGNQGRSVALSLLGNKAGTFKVRIITRNPESDAAKALVEAGATVVKADGTDREQMLAAFKESWGAFINTNGDDPALDQPGSLSEVEVGKIVLDAAADAGVKHVVYSGMVSTTEATKGKYTAVAFEDKNIIGRYAASKTAFESTTIVSPGNYMENFLMQELAGVFGGFPYVPDEEGFLTYSTPHWGGDDDVPYIAIRADYGDLVHGVLLDPAKYNGQFIQGFSQSIKSDAAVKAFEEVSGKKARYIPMKSLNDLQTYGMRALETVKSVFGFSQASGGFYYGTPNDVGPATELKRAAAEARGKEGDEAKLLTIKQFWKQHFTA
ncbi:hypothetical protein jhhlp_007652 [Lomentospora prolificans]|uniref:NmrA-like domain-containing protein n=1 Tax=Lomentospora prolificans TaxID=41688 RepID=A0A2N3N065_9PEZI|nr:hypothetical protein jhhlp_007652 [Lomentospora prolificans]